MIRRDDAKSANDKKKLCRWRPYILDETNCILTQKLYDFNSSLTAIGKTIFIRLRERELIILWLWKCTESTWKVHEKYMKSTSSIFHQKYMSLNSSGKKGIWQNILNRISLIKYMFKYPIIYSFYYKPNFFKYYD